MSEIQDDPREVLSILNSLGFVGITAHQLKSFMKDLKLYRKIKEREREAWKREIRAKILTKQRSALEEFIQGQKSRRTQHSYFKHIIPLSPLRKGDATVKIKIKSSPRDKENEEKFALKQCHYMKNQKSENLNKLKNDSRDENLPINIPKIPFTPRNVTVRDRTRSFKQETRDESVDKSKKNLTQSIKENYKKISREKSDTEQKTWCSSEKSEIQKRPTSAPEINQHVLRVRSKSVVSDSGEVTSSCPTKYSALNSPRKSFIRPWNLQPDTQRSWKKSDPVTLYQKYQEEWKHCFIPGENPHLNIRWAIREKMMGCNPNPRPTVHKSCSVPTLRKK